MQGDKSGKWQWKISDDFSEFTLKICEKDNITEIVTVRFGQDSSLKLMQLLIAFLNKDEGIINILSK